MFNDGMRLNWLCEIKVGKKLTNTCHEQIVEGSKNEAWQCESGCDYHLCTRCHELEKASDWIDISVCCLLFYLLMSTMLAVPFTWHFIILIEIASVLNCSWPLVANMNSTPCGIDTFLCLFAFIFPLETCPFRRGLNSYLLLTVLCLHHCVLITSEHRQMIHSLTEMFTLSSLVDVPIRSRINWH